MALDVWLKGKFDVEAVYDFVAHSGFFENISRPNEWTLTFHLRGVKDVAYQVYAKGKVRITTDDFSDPYDLLRILVNAVWISFKQNPHFTVVSVAPLLSSAYRIARPLILTKLGLNDGNGNIEASALAEAEANRIKRVGKAIKDLQEDTFDIETNAFQ